MSVPKTTINRREVLIAAAFTAAGSVVLGPSMYRLVEDTVVEVRTQKDYPTIEGNPKRLTRDSLRQEIRKAYQEHDGLTMGWMSAILGAAIGFISFDKVKTNASVRSHDIY